MTYIAPYLTFNGNCREAMTFYKEALGGELSLMTMGESPAGAQARAEDKNKIMHAALTNDRLVLMASDNMGMDPATHGTSINIMLNCSTEEEIRRVFGKLSTGGKVIHPLKEEFWGSIFGDFRDRFGLRWMLNWDKPKA